MSESQFQIPCGPSTVRPSDFPDKITRWIEDGYPGTKVLRIDVPTATAGVITFTVTVTADPDALAAAMGYKS